MSDADTAVRDQLDALGVAYQLVPCDPDLADTAAFCQAYGYALRDSANTIVVVGKSQPPVYAACVVLADTRLDVNHAVKQRLRAAHPAGAEGGGVRRASFASAEETMALTGMMIGGVTVFGLFLTPTFYFVIRTVTGKLGRKARRAEEVSAPSRD